jgi:NADH dehydrogenase
LNDTLDVSRDRMGRVIVQPDCSIPGRPEAFCVGDAASFTPSGSDAPLPGVSPVAMQEGRYVGRTIRRELDGQPRRPFVYLDKGSMATIGRSRAVAEVGRLRLSGVPAWIAWLAVHIFYLIDFRNRVIVLWNWAWSYVTYKRGARLITGGRLSPGASDASDSA